MSMRVVIVDDEAAMRTAMAQWFSLSGYEIDSFDRGDKILDLVDPDFPGVVVTDVKMPGLDGMSLLQALQAIDRELPVVLVTGHGDVALAVEAMRQGAYDFIEKPFEPERLTEIVGRASETRRLVLDNRRLRARLSGGAELERRLLGESPAMVRLRRDVQELAATEASVLIVGETGTGKEVVARCLHDLGSRAGATFAAVNCGAIPDHLFESEFFGHEAGAFTGALKRRTGTLRHASGGSLFLDEVASLPLAMQVKFLRALQEREVTPVGSDKAQSIDIRLISASNSNLQEAIAEERFRSDLYYRLNTIEIRVPPLRERGDDVILLFEQFQRAAEAEYDREAPALAAADLAALRDHAWPGNVRELMNLAERHVLSRGGGLAHLLGHDHPPEPADSATLAEQVRGFERQLIAKALRDHGGNIAAVMEALGLPRRTLNDKMARYGLERAGSDQDPSATGSAETRR